MQNPQNCPEDKHKHITDYSKDNANWQTYSDLSSEISNEEAISSLKYGKACGIGLILNEMLKSKHHFPYKGP